MMRRAPAAAGLALLLSLPAMAQVANGTAVWCLPSLLFQAVTMADQCGWPVQPAARQRASDAIDAVADAAVRLNVTRFAGVRQELERMTRDPDNAAGGLPARCAASREDVERFLALLTGAQAEALVRGAIEQARAAASMDGQCL